jgi:hypothetical protein
MKKRAFQKVIVRASSGIEQSRGPFSFLPRGEKKEKKGREGIMKKALSLILCCLACLAFGAGGVWGATFCVDPGGGGTHTGLQAALTAAAGNTEDDIIKVVWGTYTGNFYYSSTTGYDVSLLGGYTAACADRVANPIFTTLDGNSADSVLALYDDSGGNFEVDGFTIRNGNSTTGDGGGVNAWSNSSGTAGNITITNNIITGNSAAMSGGGVDASSYSPSGAAGTVTITNNTIQGNTADTYYGGGVRARANSDSGTAGNVVLSNNTITGNSAPSEGGGVYAYSNTTSGTAGTVTLTNNTITGNTASYEGGGAQIIATSGGTIKCYNNIIRGNTAGTGADIYLGGTFGSAYGYNNDYHDLGGSWNGGSSDNIDQDPLFADPATGDYHLQPTSPCIDKGLNTAPGIQATDCDGDARIIDGDYDSTAIADMGVDEFAAVYVILHRDGALWSSATGWDTATPPYYPGTAYAQALKLWENGGYLLLHRDGAYIVGLLGLGLGVWNTSSPPYYPGTPWAVDVLNGVILHKDGALWYAATGWVLTAPPYYPGTAYAVDLEKRTDNSYAILHKDGAIYDSATGWLLTAPPYYPGTSWAVDMKLDGSGYVLLHKDGAVWRSAGGWILTAPPYYPGTDYARALELVAGSNYVILHKDGAIYNSVTGWVMTAPPYHPGTNYAVDLEVR